MQVFFVYFIIILDLFLILILICRLFLICQANVFRQTKKEEVSQTCPVRETSSFLVQLLIQHSPDQFNGIFQTIVGTVDT